MKGWQKKLGIFLLLPAASLVIVSLLFYIPPVQRVILKKAARYAGAAWGATVEIENIRLAFPFRLSASGIAVSLPASEARLTLRSLSVRILPAPLLRQTICIDALRFQNLCLDTGTAIDGMHLQGEAGALFAGAIIRLRRGKARIERIKCSRAAFTLRIDSLSPSPEASEPPDWELDVGTAALEQIRFRLQAPADTGTFRLAAQIRQARLTDGEANLKSGRYAAGRFTLTASALSYRAGNFLPAKGLDPRCLAVDGLHIRADSVLYQEKEINILLKRFSAEERSGWSVASFEGRLHSDAERLSIPECRLKTAHSELHLQAAIPWSLFDTPSQGEMQLALTASIGKQDLFTFINRAPAPFINVYPDIPLYITARAGGNLSALHVSSLQATLPGAFTINASAQAEQVRNVARRSAQFRWEAQGGKLGFVQTLYTPSGLSGWAIPPGLRLNAEASLANNRFSARLQLSDACARLNAAVSYRPSDQSYRVALSADSLEPLHFMPGSSFTWLAATLQAEGRGTDVFSPRAQMSLKGQIDSACYLRAGLQNIGLEASLLDRQARFSLKSPDSAARMDLSLGATLLPEDIKATLIADVSHLDLYRLHLAADSFATSFQLFAEAESNLREDHKVDITLGNWELITASQSAQSKMLTLHARSAADTTLLSFHAGDLGIVLAGDAGLETMIRRLTHISNQISLQLEKDSAVAVAALRPALPGVSLQIDAARDNPLYALLQRYDTGFGSFSLNASASPREGLRLNAFVHALHRDTFLIDTVRAAVWPDSAGIMYRVDVLKNRYLRQAPFTAQLQGAVRSAFADAELLYRNQAGETGFLAGVRASKEAGALCLQFYPEEQTLAFAPYRLNPDNYIRFKNKKEIDAHLTLTGVNQAYFRLHTVDQGGDYPEVHAELGQISLQNLSDGFARLPALGGTLSADMRYAPTRESFMVALDAHADTFLYEKGDVGALMFSAVYLPVDEGAHQIDAHLLHNRREIASATALYQSARDRLDGSLSATDWPLPMLSPFIPGRMAALSGRLNGQMALAGPFAAPRMDGSLRFDSGSVYVDRAASSFRLDGKEIRLKNSILSFDTFHIYAAGVAPFVIDGAIDLSNPARMIADLRLGGREMQLLDARRTPESLVYGKLFADLSVALKGPVNALDIRGNMKLLGGTNLTYIMSESALTVQDRLKDLVTFTSFADTIIRMRRRPAPRPLGGTNMSLMLQIEPAVQLSVDLSPDRSSYAKVLGGGNLSFQYTPQGLLFLNGRYTFSEGNVNYALPVIPLKEFRIEPNSYVQWDGELMDPLLNMKATQRMRASAAAGEAAPRMVNFDVGLDIQNRLNDMKLTFLIAAPDNREIQNELVAIGPDERAKVALAMMATGKYIYGGGTGGMNLDVNSALNSFLTSEINNIAGGALKSVDISFGMETYEDRGDAKRDFSFQFAKRFYNDRIKVMVGGKVSTGAEQETEPFLDNLSAEYRLDPSGAKNVKLFHERNYESLLEGEITETGAGLVFRKKVRRLRELFDFRKKKIKPAASDE
jgi:hypothetical protein